MIRVFSPGIRRIPHLECLLGERVVSGVRGRLKCRDVHAVAGWGMKPFSQRERDYAARRGLPYLALEDGFIRSIGLGRDDPPLSMVVDELGIYYDATRPSRLEALIAAAGQPDQQKRARTLLQLWREQRVSKYNHLRDGGRVSLGTQPYVLVVDQTCGDVSVALGEADEQSFQRMLAAALSENPHHQVVVKVHPEVMVGRKQGHFNLQALAREARVTVLGEDWHPVDLIEGAEALYVVTSQMGFEGLLWGKRVRTFGMPFYAGWGITEDELPPPERRIPVALENIVHAALVDYTRYIDPECGERCEPERVIEWMGLQRRMRQRFPPVVHAWRFSPYKRPIVRGFFQGSEVRFVRRASQVPAGATLAVWGATGRPPGLTEDVALLRLEDGFIRSVGLGAELVRPLSWVVDRSGIYFDSTTPSELELTLERENFSDELVQRAARLRQRLVSEGVTKYNVGTTRWQRPVTDRPVLLVVGQVEGDASLACGAPGLRGNVELLQAVREANPGAWLVYKPHPDVVAGLRRRGEGEEGAGQWCDEVAVDASMGELLTGVDEVHTLTSLAGFEALLRGCKVVCYGQPFYAGWGLTEDRLPNSRRTRQLSLDELVAGTLFCYPSYLSRSSGRFTAPERALDELLQWRATPVGWQQWWRMPLRWLLRMARR